MEVRRRRLAVLASGSGTNLQAIIAASTAFELDADVVLVVSDQPDALALTRAADAGIPTVPLARRPAEARAEYDSRLVEVVGAAEPDLVVLAGWMRLLTMTFLGAFAGRVVNLHPARPGELPGVNAVERAFAEFERGHRSSTGVMVHLVPDEGIDDGPVLATVDVPIHSGDTLATLARRVHAAEHRLLVDTLCMLTRPPDALSLTRPPDALQELSR